MESRLLDILYHILQEIIEEEMDLRDDEESIRISLEAQGYGEEEIDLAFGWLDTYFRKPTERITGPPALGMSDLPRSLRVLSFDERMRIAPEALGFLIGLESRGLLDSQTREETLHRSMDMFEETVGLEEMKIVTLLTIFEQGQGNLDEIVKLVENSDLKTVH